MKNIILVLICSVFTLPMKAAGPGDSDIILGKVSIGQQQQVIISELENITNRKGYDNQPSFSPDGKFVLYTAMFEGDKQQTDIMQLIIKNCDSCQHTLKNVTNSPVSEYSPTPMDLVSFTSVVVEPDNKQRIWKYSLEAKNDFNAKEGPILIEQNMEPVGYFAWGLDSELAMFILGKPHSLQYKASKSSSPLVIDTDIGRSVKKIPHQNWFSYIKEAAKPLGSSQARAFSVAEPNKTVKLIELPKKAEYFNWHPSGRLFSAVGNKLVTANFSQWPNHSATIDWAAVEHSQSVCAEGHITRIAFSQNGDKIAFVCQWP
jgi:hypothetical protein